MGSARIGVVETSEYRGRDDLTCRLTGSSVIESSRNALLNALVGSGAIEVVGVFLDDAVQLVPVNDQYVIKALPLQAADTALANSVGPRCSKWGLEFFDTGATGDRAELLAVLAVAVPDEKSWSCAPGGGFADWL